MSVFVEFAGGCTGAAGQVSHWVITARSFASGLFPRCRDSTLGPAHKAAHMAAELQIPQNPPSMSDCMWGLW